MSSGADETGETPHLQFPPRMFVVGDEPLGIRVTSYHKPSAITKILNALTEDEIEAIRKTAFGKLVEIADKPSFSGRFGRFLISRQLKIVKKHEAWFLFAGKPVRFSIREFAMVTGLNCRKYPTNSKKRSTKSITEKPYWGELFGLMTEVQHAEKIKDVDQFLVFPWGRASFDMLMSSIKERDEVSLLQNTIALKGFVLSLQLVMIEAVPSLTEVVEDGGSSASDGDESDDEDGKGKKSINTGHVSDIDTVAKAHVVSIITAGVEEFHLNPELGSSDDDEDVLVANLVKCVEDGFAFANSHFIGGATKADVNRMREDGKTGKNRSRKNTKVNLKEPVTDAVDADYVADIVRKSVSAELCKMGEQIKNLSDNVTTSHPLFRTDIQGMFQNFQRDITKFVTPLCTAPHIPPPLPTPHSTQSGMRNPSGSTTPANANNIINEAVRFANQHSLQTKKGITAEKGVVEETNDDDADVNLESEPNADGRSDTDDPAVETNPHLQDSVKADVLPDTNAPAVETNPHLQDSVKADVLPDTNAPAVETNPHLQDSENHPKSKEPTDVGHSRVPLVAENDPISKDSGDTSLAFPRPTFSLGLTQEDPQLSKTSAPDSEDYGDEHMTVDPPPTSNENDAPAPLYRKSKRPRVVPRSLVGDYQCDKRILVLDVLIHHTRSVFQSHPVSLQSKNSVFLDTKFVSLLAKTFAKFSKASKKEIFRFPAALADYLVQDFPIDEANRFYFPFNFDKKHWVGVCVDSSLGQVSVLDSNTSLRTDGMITSEMRSISQMFPYILRQAGKQISSKDMKTFTIDRPRSIPQNTTSFDSGVTSILIIQAHAVGGLEVCKCITPDVLDIEVERLAVMIYEENIGVI
uniref:Ubiquitin-like protease family profile domain-containing protein n=1 Tax=Brassica oleracea var. oleracea TaxID=109376 RepID=A0A0D3CJB0_BRAOL